MTHANPTDSLLPIAIAILSLLWLAVCAIYDLRTRHIPNWLTLPALPLALLASWLSQTTGNEDPGAHLFRQVLLLLPLFFAWQKQLLGGADLKILLVLSLINPLLLVAAWAGVVVAFAGIAALRRHRLERFAGVPGFALGVGLFYLAQFALSMTRQLSAG